VNVLRFVRVDTKRARRHSVGTHVLDAMLVAQMLALKFDSRVVNARHAYGALLPLALDDFVRNWFGNNWCGANLTVTPRPMLFLTIAAAILHGHASPTRQKRDTGRVAVVAHVKSCDEGPFYENFMKLCREPCT
jgi:hypothetical protein